MLYFIIWMLFCHWFADFVAQSDDMAKKKSSDENVLLAHVAVYSGILILGYLIASFLVDYTPRWAFLLNVPSHLLIDYSTSKINARLYKNEQRHWFFVSIGFDQFLHYVVLLLTI